ncbi:hypothetical protein RD792_015350 [Penstemon davidsonii]|uniref:Uncharacterized protein n=1 Tax=Penstemon davidsonii TaxID=160366 RepID=A0ABR0CRX2_9LAMI|nr:hypothetical protein RD792_015350 [Penstemon davidsonii]
MDFLSNLTKSDESKPKSDESKPTSDNPDHKPSNSDIISNAKLVASAAQSHFNNEPDKYDKEKVACASADIIDYAEKYGKLDETKGVGKYVEQAEDYLRDYGNKPAAPVAAAGEHKPTTAPPETTEATEKKSGGEGEGLMKMAGGLFNK